MTSFKNSIIAVLPKKTLTLNIKASMVYHGKVRVATIFS